MDEMSNINIQTHAARLGLSERKLKKTEVQGVLEALYNQAGDDWETASQLARLYATLAPKVSPKKNPLSWVVQACSKEDDQPERRHIFVRDGYAIGSDNFRIHFYKIPFDSAEYEGKFIDCDYNVLDLPNVHPLDAAVIKYYMPTGEDMCCTQQIDLSACEVVPLEDSTETAYKMDLFGNVYHFKKRFVDQIAPNHSFLTAYAKDAGNEYPVWFNAGENKTALLMSVRVKSED